MNLKSNSVWLLALVLPITACFASGVTAAEAEDPVAGIVRLNQLGYLPGAQKLAVLPDSAGGSFSIIEKHTGMPVFSDKQGTQAKWAPSGENVRVADFSAVTKPGEYLLRA